MLRRVVSIYVCGQCAADGERGTSGLCGAVERGVYRGRLSLDQ